MVYSMLVEPMSIHSKASPMVRGKTQFNRSLCFSRSCWSIDYWGFNIQFFDTSLRLVSLNILQKTYQNAFGSKIELLVENESKRVSSLLLLSLWRSEIVLYFRWGYIHSFYRNTNAIRMESCSHMFSPAIQWGMASKVHLSIHDTVY